MEKQIEKTPYIRLKNTEKAGFPDGKPRFAMTNILYFLPESKKC